MKIRIYLFDEYQLGSSLELLDYTDVYRELDKNRDVCWIYTLDQRELSREQENALNNDQNIKSWKIFKIRSLPSSI